jgi:hypothetical protein
MSSRFGFRFWEEQVHDMLGMHLIFILGRCEPEEQARLVLDGD